MSIAEELKASIIAGRDERPALRKILEAWPHIVDAYYHACVKARYTREEVMAEYSRMASEKVQ